MTAGEVAYYKAIFSLGSDVGSSVDEFANIIKDMSAAEAEVQESIAVSISKSADLSCAFIRPS